MNLLIPYIRIYDHHDPLFEEYTYGDIDIRARKLKKDLKKDDFVFFHTSINGKKLITAYYVVDRVLDVVDIFKDRTILEKYKNPHILDHTPPKNGKKEDNVVLFGDPISSRILVRPLYFDKSLAQKLSLNIKFPEGKTETQTIGSATRSWRVLSDKDVDVLLKEIRISEERPLSSENIMSTEEVLDILERDVENYLEKKSALLGKSLKLIRRQFDTPVGRIDLLFEGENGEIIIVELKLGKIGREAVAQLRRYMNWLKKETKKEPKGAIVCSGVMPAFEQEFKRFRDIKIFFYGWQMKIRPWPEE